MDVYFEGHTCTMRGNLLHDNEDRWWLRANKRLTKRQHPAHNRPFS